jgi:hypothetical protein
MSFRSSVEQAMVGQTKGAISISKNRIAGSKARARRVGCLRKIVLGTISEKIRKTGVAITVAQRPPT